MNIHPDPDGIDALPEGHRAPLLRGRRRWRDDPEWLDQLDRKMAL